MVIFLPFDFAICCPGDPLESADVKAYRFHILAFLATIAILVAYVSGGNRYDAPSGLDDVKTSKWKQVPATAAEEAGD